MKIVGMMLVRNEDWCVGLSATAALKWCDQLVVLDDGSTDATPDVLSTIARQHGDNRIVYQYETRDDPHAWREMEMRQWLFDLARHQGGTHFAVIDADEVPTAKLIDHLPQILGSLTPQQGISVPMISPWDGIQQRRVDGNFQPYSGIFIGFRNAPSLAWKRESDGYQHHHRAPYGCRSEWPMFGPEEGGIMHLQFASMSRLKAKAAYYKAFETINYPGRMTAQELNRKYDWTLSEEGMSLRPISSDWWQGHATQYLDLNAEAWQSKAFKDIVDKHGLGPFAGLEMHGLI